MEAQTQPVSGSTATSAPSVPSESAAPSAEPIRVPPLAAPAQPEPCRHCKLVGNHVEPTEPVACETCGNAHGSTTKALDRQTGELVDRRVIVTHSLEGVVRGDDGQWRPAPICTLCVADLKCRTYEAQRATPKGQPKSRWPNFWALHIAAQEAADRNAQQELDREVQPRFDREVGTRGEGFRKAVLFRLRANRSAGLAAALDAELAVLRPLDAFVARYGNWARGVVFAHMRDARCSLEAAIEAKRAEIEEVGRVQLRREALLAKGYNLTDGPRGGNRRERGDRRQRRDGDEGRGPRRDSRGNRRFVDGQGNRQTFVMSDDVERE
ncbi:hypothetical protein HY635_00990 [Candidatus Uhrbacteria bacterium]|nr:hypothetical protein [Candidatus Uhrbacteria bacterium]